MMSIENPLDVNRELMAIRKQSEAGLNLLAECEQKRVRLELEAERQEALAFLDSQGTIPDRQAVAKLKSQEAREAAELAKVEVNRIKSKLRHLSEALMATQSAGKMIELQFRTAGLD
jgi:hypothetical protein